MHVVIATDGSRQSLTAAKKFKSFADPEKVTEISIVAVIRPLAAIAFANDLSSSKQAESMVESTSSRRAASDALDALAAVFDGWHGKVHKRIRSGSPANEIIKAAKTYGAELVVIAAGSRGLSDTVLMGSTAQRVQHYAPCPVLVVRPTKKPSRIKEATKKAVPKKAAPSKSTAKKTTATKASAAKPAATRTATKKAPAKKAAASKTDAAK
ncbi:nucleotide-binding universal stress UspA family protein [Nocardioides daedukensis]|uniref:Nucleotide-binding universal stress UspA family protein n=1 Tax=Nocardioides daedukensis TaxID=634462 RepID=A0A7Y9UU78_9ACTN|nr:universal stress protein [Nocardioides daedukensis]NYG60194.1 nucleotide-binding universal stress UspA family protein [Nocardioides daedukensis]